MCSSLCPCPRFVGPGHRDVLPSLGEEGHQGDTSLCACPLCPLSGIVQSDPLVPMDRTLIPSPPSRPKNPVFDDEEKSKVRDIQPVVSSD